MKYWIEKFYVAYNLKFSKIWFSIGNLADTALTESDNITMELFVRKEIADWQLIKACLEKNCA